MSERFPSRFVVAFDRFVGLGGLTINLHQPGVDFAVKLLGMLLRPFKQAFDANISKASATLSLTSPVVLFGRPVGRPGPISREQWNGARVGYRLPSSTLVAFGYRHELRHVLLLEHPVGYPSHQLAKLFPIRGDAGEQFFTAKLSAAQHEI